VSRRRMNTSPHHSIAGWFASKTEFPIPKDKLRPARRKKDYNMVVSPGRNRLGAPVRRMLLPRTCPAAASRSRRRRPASPDSGANQVRPPAKRSERLDPEGAAYYAEARNSGLRRYGHRPGCVTAGVRGYPAMRPARWHWRNLRIRSGCKIYGVSGSLGDDCREGAQLVREGTPKKGVRISGSNAGSKHGET